MQNLMQLSAICAHISTKLAFLRSQSNFIPLKKAKLTPRELQIASLVANGLTNAEIATQLWISQNTVKQTLKRIFQKLNVSARAEMVAKLQLISCPVKDLSLRPQGGRGAGEQGRGFCIFCTDVSNHK